MRRRRSYSEPVGVRSKVGHFNRPKWDINSDAYTPDLAAREGLGAATSSLAGPDSPRLGGPGYPPAASAPPAGSVGCPNLRSRRTPAAATSPESSSPGAAQSIRNQSIGLRLLPGRSEPDWFFRSSDFRTPIEVRFIALPLCQPHARLKRGGAPRQPDRRILHVVDAILEILP